MSQLLTLDAVSALIRSGKTLLLSGHEKLLAALPQGKWIGGTIPYFMTEEGGVHCEDKVFVRELPDYAEVSVRRYTSANLHTISADHGGHGFTVLILPGFSETLSAYAKNFVNYRGIYDRPLVGWVSGVAMSEVGKVPPKVFDGTMGVGGALEAIAMHVTIPAEYEARVNIVNLFRQSKGDVITFEDIGFRVVTAYVNGEQTSLAEYISKNKIDTKLPLVADFGGTMVNVGIQSIGEKSGIIKFFAPVFPGVEYRFAAPVKDYVAEFKQKFSGEEGHLWFGCNCILNYLYAELEGRSTGRMTGPMTFGEIAYLLLNQTAVYLTVEKINKP